MWFVYICYNAYYSFFFLQSGQIVSQNVISGVVLLSCKLLGTHALVIWNFMKYEEKLPI